jgi:hypothetical protein
MNAAAICSYLLRYAEPSLSGLTDEHLALEPMPNVKTAGWIIGHLTVTGDFIRRRCGRPPLTPREWGPLFTIGSQPSKSRESYPSMSELTSAFRGVYRDLADAAPTFDAALLAQPNPFEAARGIYPTTGDFLQWIMTGHLGYHLGQLSIWRGAAGLELRPGAAGAI